MKRLPIYLSLLLLLTCAKEDSQDPGTTPSNITPKYILTATAGEGGSVAPSSGSFNSGTQVSVTATPSAGYTFSGWSNGSSDNPVTVTLSSNTSITANFALIPVYTLSLNSYENQRSGIVFRWGHYTSNINSISTSSDMGEGNGHFAGGQAYHDVNNDGFQDILVTFHNETNESSTNWYLNQGDDKHFTKTYLINSSTSGLSSFKILKTDVNNDNRADFILLGVDESEPGNYGGNFTVLKQTTEGTFDVISIDDGYGLWYHTGAAGDLNNDGFVDVVGSTYIWLGDGTGNFTNTNISVEDFGVEPALSYEILDINNDGFNDIVVGTQEPGPDMYGSTSSILLGKSTFGEYNVISLPSTETTYTNDLEFLDYDNDGDLDILELRGIKSGHDEHSTYTFIHLYINNNLTFTLDNDVFSEAIDGGYLLGSYDINGWSRIKIDDIDGDGVDDIVQENHNDSYLNGLKKINGKWEKYEFY